MSKTDENLMAAFAGESQANRKYLAFAKKAEKEGLIQIAKLFRAVAEAETVHAHNHLNVAGSVKSTEENLKAAVQGETYEFSEMYPEFIKQAESDGNKLAKQSFEHANIVEKEHEALYKKALVNVETGKDLDATDMNVCQVCGHTVEGDAPEVCPVCQATKDKFKKIE
ncbi:rubrerythrin family protein [Candidatus Woesearchaeota archaeon]|nr:rubrerythrin family protein [Candidatus Woesearchaeota archaeon]